MKVSSVNDKIPNLEEKVLFPATQAELPYEQSENLYLEERKELETTE